MPGIQKVIWFGGPQAPVLPQIPGTLTPVFSYPNGFAGVGNAINLVPNAALAGNNINLTAGPNTHQVGAAWYTTQVNVATGFTTDFTFNLFGTSSVPSILGMAFVLQNSNLSTNPPGSGLAGQVGINNSSDANNCGYGAYWYNLPSAGPPKQFQYGIGNSIAIKFDMNNNSGNTDTFLTTNSPNTTGLYVNVGPSATLTPADDLNPSGINFYTGDVMAAHIVYDGTLLTMVLKDTVTNVQFRKSWPINIPAAIGGNTGWVGFTAGQGPNAPLGPNQVLTWSFSQGFNTRLATPTFSVAAGQYTTTQNVTISGPGTIYYSTNGRAPTSSSTLYTGPVSVSASTYLQAVAIQSGFTDSLVGAANYQIQANGLPTPINFPSGFASASNLMSVVGAASISGANLQLTGPLSHTASTGSSPTFGGCAGAAWYVAPVNIGAFTCTFTLQFTNSSSNGVTFCIQTPPLVSDFNNNNLPPFNTDTILRWSAGGPLTVANAGLPVGYGYAGNTGNAPTFPEVTGCTRSVAVKFDPSAHNGSDTGIYNFTPGATNISAPDVSANSVDMSGSNVHLNNLHAFNVVLTYSGTTLTMSVTDATTLAVFSTSFTINIPSIMGGSKAYVGFTGSNFSSNAQNVSAWTYAG